MPDRLDHRHAPMGDSTDAGTDAGLARERTQLAWNRSGLAVIVCIAVLLRRLWPLRGGAQLVTLGLIAAAAIVWASAVLALRVRVVRGGRRFSPGHRPFHLMAAGTVALGAAAVVLALFTPG